MRVDAVVGEIAVHDPDQAKQLRRACKSVAYNVAEGSGMSGGNRRVHYERALGSARETRMNLELAAACGYLPFDPALDDQLDHIIAVLVKVTR